MEIELVGTKAKLKSITEILKDQSMLSVGGEWKNIELSLRKMEIEEIINLKTIEAKYQKILEQREVVSRFIYLDKEFNSLKNSIFGYTKNDGKRRSGMNYSLQQYGREIEKINKILENPTPDMLPLKIFQDTVTIYPIEQNASIKVPGCAD